MNLTNKYNLPDAIVRAVKNDLYDKGHGDFSATELLKPPRQRALIKKHFNEIKEDVSDRIWSLLGQAAHVVCERGNVNDIVEKRFYGKFRGDRGLEDFPYIVSAQIDNLSIENDTLTDFKVTTVYKAIPGKDPDPDWIAQLNIQREILDQNDKSANNLQIIAILRDWSKTKMNQEFKADRPYPPTNLAVIKIPIWSSDKTINFIDARIRLHNMAETHLPECTKEERWASENTYALMKKGQKRAVKLFQDRIACKAACDTLKDHYMEFRPGESKRCMDYCSASEFCLQYKREQRTANEKEMNEKRE